MDDLPPPQEIAPGLYRLRTPMTSAALPWIMPYAFLGAQGVTLFDSGYGTVEAQAALTSQLRALGREPSDVERLIVSHAHPDHLGMAGWLREQSGCELVMLGREAASFAESHGNHDDWMVRSRRWAERHGFDAEEMDRDVHEGMPPWVREQRERAAATAAANGQPADVASETERRGWMMTDVAPDVSLEDGDVMEFDGFRLVAVWTPGHTPGHLCIHAPDLRLTFTGDHVLSRITPNVSVGPEDEESGRNPLREFRASLEKTAALDTRLALPAHEELIEDLPGRCREILSHHDHRAEEVLAGIGSGHTSAAEIASRVTWNKPWSTFSFFKKRSALGETLSHLVLLEGEGRARSVEADGRVTWERA